MASDECRRSFLAMGKTRFSFLIVRKTSFAVVVKLSLLGISFAFLFMLSFRLVFTLITT